MLIKLILAVGLASIAVFITAVLLCVSFGQWTFSLPHVNNCGAISQAKGAFSSWWSNFLVSPEPGQKAPESPPIDAVCAEEAEIDPTDNLINIPKSISSDKDQEILSNGNAIKGKDICEVNGVELQNHQPGEVHTV